MFGEVSLLHDIPRIATIITQTDCELLLLTKADFEVVLRATVQAMWTEVEVSMRTIPYFDDLAEQERRECVIVSKIVTFEPTQVIFGDGYGSKNYVYYVLHGTCKLVENISIKRDEHGMLKLCNEDEMEMNNTEESGMDMTELVNIRSEDSFLPTTQGTQQRNEAADDLDDKQRRPVTEPPQPPPAMSARRTTLTSLTTETHFFQVCLMRDGACFNNGENLQRRRVIAITAVKCLLIPFYWLSTHDPTNAWAVLRQFTNLRIPSTQKLFDRYRENRAWTKYKRTLTADILARRNVRVTTSKHDTPLYLRVNGGA